MKDITRCPTRRMSVKYGYKYFTMVSMNMNDQISIDIQLLPDEAEKMVDELEKFLVLAAQHTPLFLKLSTGSAGDTLDHDAEGNPAWKLDQIKDALDMIQKMPKAYLKAFEWELIIPKSQLPILKAMHDEIDVRPIKYCRKHANRICALSLGEGCLAQQGTGDQCELQMGSGYISLGSNEDADIEEGE